MEVSWYSDARKNLPAGTVPDCVTDTTEPTFNVEPVDVAQVDTEASGAGEESKEEEEEDAGESENTTKPAPSAEDVKAQPDEATSKATVAIDPALPEHRAICDICRVRSCFLTSDGSLMPCLQMNPIRGPLYKCLESVPAVAVRSDR
jgi:hypothetical protein